MYAWGLEEIRSARDAQMLGRFQRAVALAQHARTDPAMLVAYQNRLAPQRGLPVKLVPPKQTARAMRVLDEAQGLFGAKGVGVRVETLVNVNGDLANHCQAIGVNVLTPRADGSRIDFEMKYWPLEWVRWDPTDRCLKTRIDAGTGSERDRTYGITSEVPIIHGDGRWVVFSKAEHEPWKQDAAILGAVVWAIHAFAQRDWAKASVTHGNQKVVGELPAGTDDERAAAFLELVRQIASEDSPYGLRLPGSKIDLLASPSTAWQIFKELSDDSGKWAARLYLGQDGTTGTSDGAPGVSLQDLFGIRNDIIEGDLRAIERAIKTGVIDPWCALNFGDSSLAPWRLYEIPDPDQDSLREAKAKQRAEFHAEVERLRKGGFVIDQAVIEQVAADVGIVPPQLAPAKEGAQLAPEFFGYELEAGAYTLNEWRGFKGIDPVPWGNVTSPEFKARLAAEAAAAGAAPPATPAPDAARAADLARGMRPIAR